ncbi:glycerol-3-phosphate 1-O-acyltransferase PlsY [Methyloceanibacter sp.]|jgi:glycerol-3-phosphate acyltransferase PlsY|uniref:glycerol-3-phosphate 1-O-acyltransferase PlsY n=1 Tax=Methyloceanibacter sp. TaxID=1965321 RepID=UPI002BA7B35A|nr:glycerol-3-phosphate 1-O-acyltransferase PlsY [Methyloceanibacter sp.]
MSPADWSDALTLAAAFAGGYLLGSIPFGLILGKLAGLGDVREVGSGNIGATNVLRAGGKKLAALTLLLDAGKGTAAVLIAARFGGEPAALAAGLGAFLGHLYPVWLGFRGGKGVATYIGVVLGLHWPAALAFCGVWLLVALVTRYSSLAALAASAATLAILAALGNWPLATLALVFTVLLIVRHRSNIQRLLRREETRIGESND